MVQPHPRHSGGRQCAKARQRSVDPSKAGSRKAWPDPREQGVGVGGEGSRCVPIAIRGRTLYYGGDGFASILVAKIVLCKF